MDDGYRFDSDQAGNDVPPENLSEPQLRVELERLRREGAQKDARISRLEADNSGLIATNRDQAKRIPRKGWMTRRLESIPLYGETVIAPVYRAVKVPVIAVVATGALLFVGGIAADAWDGITHPAQWPYRDPGCEQNHPPSITFSKESPMPFSDVPITLPVTGTVIRPQSDTADGRYGVAGLPNQGFAQVKNHCRSLVRFQIPHTPVGFDVLAPAPIKHVTVTFEPITNPDSGYTPPAFDRQININLSPQELRDNTLFDPDTVSHGNTVTFNVDVLGGAEWNLKPGNHITPDGEQDQWGAYVTYTQSGVFGDHKVHHDKIGTLTLNTLRADDPRGYGLAQYLTYKGEIPVNSGIRGVNNWIENNVPGWMPGSDWIKQNAKFPEVRIDEEARGGDMFVRRVEHAVNHGMRKYVVDPLATGCSAIKVCTELEQ